MPELIPAEPGSPEWLAVRRQGVTATDIVSILGLSHWDSPYSLFWRKLGQVPEVGDNDRFRLGRALETYVLERWEQERDYAGLAEDGALYRHSERAWQMATLDYYVMGAGKPVAVVECKSWADADRHTWGQGELPEPHDAEWAAERSKIPPQVRAQVLWQMDVMDVATGHVGVVFLPSGEFKSYTIEHICPSPGKFLAIERCSLCLDISVMREAGEEFMRRLRLELPPPDPDSSAATLAAVRARFVKAPAKQAEIDRQSFLDWRGACDMITFAEDKKREAEIILREQAGEAGEYTVDGQVVARRVVSDSQVKAHTRHTDYLRRVTPKGDDE